MNHFVQDPPIQTQLPIDFLIIGGGIAGLSCALALRRVGHRALVLEREPTIATQGSGCLRMPPNLTKILYHWGLLEQLRPIASKTQAVELLLLDTGEVLGTHVWDEDLLRETRGEFILSTHADLQRVLYNTAISHGADVRLGADVLSIDPEGRSVVLVGGEVLRADVIIGADGVMGIARQLMVEDDAPVHVMNCYSSMIPRVEIMKDEELASYIYDRDYESMFSWFGDGRVSLGIPLGDDKEFTLVVYSSRDGQEKTWRGRVPIENMQKTLECAEPRLRKLQALAGSPSCIPVYEYQPLDDWVHDSGRMLLIGEAAHPHPPSSIQAAAMAIEDGAVLARLFAHLRSEDQIQNFLVAFESLRQLRCTGTQKKEHGDIQFMAYPPGPAQEARDNGMRIRRDAGLSILKASEGEEETPEWSEMIEMFGYDAEDEADNWWQEWGILRLRAKGGELPGGVFGSVVVKHQVGGG